MGTGQKTGENLKKILLWFFVVASPLLLSGCEVGARPDGGVYKSIDGGSVFEQKAAVRGEESLGNSNILDLEIDLADPSSVYIGTPGLGLLKSFDGGESWMPNQQNFKNVNEIEINPQDTNNVYIAALVQGRGKILKTNDGGTVWKEIFTQRANGVEITALAISVRDSNILYAGDSLGGIYRTSDAGETWQSLFWARSGIREIEIDPGGPIYFVTVSSGILRSDDGGENFTEINTDATVYNLEIIPSGGTIYVSDSAGLKKSTDRGENFSQIETLVNPRNLGARGLAVTQGGSGDVIFFSSLKALYRSNDGGSTWKPIQFNIAREIGIIRIDPQNSNVIYLGTQKISQTLGSGLFPF